jgi:glucose-1-phosphate adenylyltransferase
MERPKLVLILAGDHVYKMDYSEIIAAHLESGAELTIACAEVPREEATRFGVMTVDDDLRVRSFDEKPTLPAAMPGHPDRALVSMGIYVFDTTVLVREVVADAAEDGAHDFGRNVIPRLIAAGRHVRAFAFRDRNLHTVSYWRDIGTLDSYYDANMDLVAVSPIFNLYDDDWPIRTYQRQAPPAKTVFRGGDRQGEILDSLVTNGCIISWRGSSTRSSDRASSCTAGRTSRTPSSSTASRSVATPASAARSSTRASPSRTASASATTRTTTGGASPSPRTGWS